MDIYQKAMQKIKHDQICKPTYIMQVTTIGPTGPTGPAPDFQIGTVATGAPGTNASVTLTKTQ